MSLLNSVEVNGHTYSVLECAYLRPWPKSSPWVARIEEILVRIANNNKVKTFLGVRWFYRRWDLLPSAVAEYPPCEDDQHEVYMSKGKLDEVACDMLEGPCRVVSSADVPDLSSFLREPDCFFYRYEYNPSQRDRCAPIFTWPGGLPISAGAPSLHKEAVSSKRAKAEEAGATSDGSGSVSSRQRAIVSSQRDSAAGAGQDTAAGVEDVTLPGACNGKPSRRDRTREEKQLTLQAKLDAMFPPFSAVDGTWTVEFVGVIPEEGEKYEGEGCARCNVRGCDRFGLLFHLKNLMTHGSPRGGQPSKVPASRTHAAALKALLGYTPEPAPLPKEAEVAPRKSQKAKHIASKMDRETDEASEVHKSARGQGAVGPVLARQREVLQDAAGEREVRQLVAPPLPRDRHGHQESRNFMGHDGKCIHYRGMKLPFRCGQVLLLRRQLLTDNPARNVKFLGNLTGTSEEWTRPLAIAQERASHADLVLLLAFRYDDLHLSLPGGLDSNHCLHLFNHYRPEGKKMISKWETYMPVALHRTYERLMRQPLSISPQELELLRLENLFDALREKEIVRMRRLHASSGPAGSLAEAKQRTLLLVTRKWTSSILLKLDERVLCRFADGSEWYGGKIAAATSGVFEVEYDDGDYEYDVTRDRLLSVEREAGEWSYLVSGPNAGSTHQHPWWPVTEQFVDMISVEVQPSQVPAEVCALQAAAAERYAGEGARPWPLECLMQAEADGSSEVRKLAMAREKRQAMEEGRERELLLAESAAHREAIAADLCQPRNREAMVYMFQKLSKLFFEIVDADLRASHLEPQQPLGKQLTLRELELAELSWHEAPVAEIAEGTRQKCDVCETSIFNRHWACRVPGCEWEVCLSCHRQGERRRAARRQRAQREARGEAEPARKRTSIGRMVVPPNRAVHRPKVSSSRGQGGGGAASSGEFARRGADRPQGSQQRNPYEGTHKSLQDRIDAVFPVARTLAGEAWHEFRAALPTDGKYAGQPCATCNVVGCPMFGKIFHHKNIATHGRPRGPGTKTIVFSRQHDAAVLRIMSAIVKSSESVLSVERSLAAAHQLNVQPLPAPPDGPAAFEMERAYRPKKLKGGGRKVERTTGGDGERGGGVKAFGKRKGSGQCPACRGKHRAHTCGKKLRRAGPMLTSLSSGVEGFDPERARLRHARHQAALRLAHETDPGSDDEEADRRRKRQRTVAHRDEEVVDVVESGVLTQEREGETGDEDEEEEILCFCDTERHLPTNEYAFEGAWVACDRCSRWCHGECAGLTKFEAEQLEHFVCPPCQGKKAQHDDSAGRAQSTAAPSAANRGITSGADSDELPRAASPLAHPRVPQVGESREGEAEGEEVESDQESDQGEDGEEGEEGEEGDSGEDTSSRGSGEESVCEEAEDGLAHSCGESVDEAASERLSHASCEEGGEESVDEEAAEDEVVEDEAAEEEGYRYSKIDDDDDYFHMSRPAVAEVADADDHDGDEAFAVLDDEAGLDEDAAIAASMRSGKSVDSCSSNGEAESDREGSSDDEFGIDAKPESDDGTSGCEAQEGASMRSEVHNIRGNATSVLVEHAGAEQCTLDRSTSSRAAPERAEMALGQSVPPPGEAGVSRRLADVVVTDVPSSGDVAAESAVVRMQENAQDSQAAQLVCGQCAPNEAPAWAGLEAVGDEVEKVKPVQRRWPSWAAERLPPSDDQEVGWDPRADGGSSRSGTTSAGEPRSGAAMALSLAPAPGAVAPSEYDGGAARAAAEALTALPKPAGGGSSSRALAPTAHSRAGAPRVANPLLVVGSTVKVLREGLEGELGHVSNAKCGYYQVQLSHGRSAHFRGKELELQPGSPRSPQVAPPALKLEIKRAPRPSTSKDDGSSSPFAAPWWAKQGVVDGSRKRKPTQLFGAGGFGEGPRSSDGCKEEGVRSSPSVRTAADGDQGLSLGASVIILKPGIHENEHATVVNMHNGYFQVQTSEGDLLNMRSKELALSRHDAEGPVRKPTVSVIVPRREGGSAIGSRANQPRRQTDIVVGHQVIPNRGKHLGQRGRVTASRNGYMVVLFDNGRSAYFRGKDLQRCSRGANEASVRARTDRRAGRVPERETTRPAQPAVEREEPRERVSWKSMAEEVEDHEPRHEHDYARAIKVEPSEMVDVIWRAEQLLLRFPPERSPAHPPPDFRSESLILEHSGEPSSDGWPALHLFQQRWRRGEPVVVAQLQKRLRCKWGPCGFLQRFGAEEVQMIDCRDGKNVHWLTLSNFFAGYLHPWMRARCPDTFRRMMLKLKDWPPDQDFKVKMPEYFDDLMQALPFPQYTSRDGMLNLSKYFPHQYVPPDLGPKMYNAFGRRAAWRGMDPKTPKGGHTNLHCDIADAVNVMLDVGIDDEDDSDDDEDENVLNDRELGDLRAARGAIWDIYRWEDSDAILQLLHAVARERDIEITHNPIHDQLFYLDDGLRERLAVQYGVRGWRILQRHGDCIFIPAGCPHQVRNLSSCVKVALDFVSPENAHRCVTLTNEFAKLPRGHHFSEDKLQVKAMVLHAMSHVSEALMEHQKQADESRHHTSHP